ncbi:hypothetical protein [Corynebacterium renale]|uniref:Subtilisin inhibitor-like n=1 Tax=Corynebacterium renale TaxID=1724 RepID=A0A2A9DNU6_9CORY|nr:hypothetical protein [Corynebacterium renale]PFG28417.1 hypothetical protein ATK06_1528 [Corynebacterium renale]SQI26441.1 putative secreted protein [Corynebacterium renale]
MADATFPASRRASAWYALTVLSSGLFLSACNGETPAQTTSTVASTITHTSTHASPDTTTMTVESRPTSPVPAPPTTELDYTVQPGSRTTINGNSATVCINGDGFGLNVVAAGDNTSCDFASAVMRTLTDGLNATYDSVLQRIPQTITAVSPVTGQSYQMDCTQPDPTYLVCTGGAGAAVYMY